MRFPVSQEEIIDAVDAEYRRERERDEFARFLNPPPPTYRMVLYVAKAYVTVEPTEVRFIVGKRKRKRQARR